MPTLPRTGIDNRRGKINLPYASIYYVIIDDGKSFVASPSSSTCTHGHTGISDRTQPHVLTIHTHTHAHTTHKRSFYSFFMTFYWIVKNVKMYVRSRASHPFY